MKIDVNESSQVILKAFDRLKEQIQLTNKTNNEKEVLDLLIDKVQIYYIKKMEKLSINDTTKIFNLESFVTDIIADINTAILNDADTFEYVRKINSKIRDSEINNIIHKHDLMNPKLR